MHVKSPFGIAFAFAKNPDRLQQPPFMIEHSPTYQPPPDEGLDIRYIDDDLLVVDKPAGLLSVPGRWRGRFTSKRQKTPRPRARPLPMCSKDALTM